MDFIGGDAWMDAMYSDIFRLLMVQFELAGGRARVWRRVTLLASTCCVVLQWSGPVAHRLEHCDGVVAMMCGRG